jgi:uncharacterized membrane protein
MTLKGFLFILASALFHVLWNTFLKASEDKPSAVTFMMAFTVVGMLGYTWWLQALGEALDWGVLLSAFVAGFFFFLYQHLVAKSYATGDLSRVYPLTVTGPIYIAVWSMIILGEHISPSGAAGILAIVYGAMTIQTNTLRLRVRSLLGREGIDAGVVFALLAAFFYSFGAVADKIGVTVGQVSPYTFDLCVFMFLFHLGLLAIKDRPRLLRPIANAKLWPVLCGGVVMLLSFVTFRIGLEEVQASYASALRQVSALFGLWIGYFFFREPFGLQRVVSTLCIVAGVALIKLG